MLWKALEIVRPDRWFFGFGSMIKWGWEKNQLLSNDSISQLPAPTWTQLDSCPEFQVFQHGRCVKIVLTRPEKGNSLTLAMISALTDLFLELSANKSIYRIMLTAEGKYFCTGMDLREPRPTDPTDHFSALYDLFEAIDNCPQTTIAVCNGPAFGGGVGLAFVFDIRICVSDATMCLTEVKLGLCPATISKFVVREWGIGLARMAMLSGRKIHPEELHRIGTVHTVVPSRDELASATDQWLQELKFTAPVASSWCKKLAKESWRDPGGKSQYQNSRDAFVAMVATGSESKRGMADFKKGIKGTNWEVIPEVTKKY